MDQLAFLFRDFVTVSAAARILSLSEQRIRQLADAGHVTCRRDRTGRRYLHEPSLKELALERQVLALMSGRRKTGPKGPRRSVQATLSEFETATA